MRWVERRCAAEAPRWLRSGVLAAVVLAGVASGAAQAAFPDRGKALLAKPHRPVAAVRCLRPRGSRVAARDGKAMVVIAGNRSDVLRIYGCVRTLGKERLLATEDNTYGSSTLPQSFVVAGRFAAISFLYFDKYQGCDSFLDVYDLNTGRVVSSFHAGCTFIRSPIPAAIDSLSLNSRGFSAWKVAEPIPRDTALTGVSCATPTLCVAVDGAGDALTATDPTGGRSAWTISPIDPRVGLAGVSCPVISLCVAFEAFYANIFTSTNPTGGVGAWSATQVEHGDLGSDGLSFPVAPSGISCPTESLCVAVDDAGNVLTSANPARGAGAWTSSLVDSSAGNFDPRNLPNTVSCPAVSLCVATDDAGNLLTSTDPAGGAGAWTVATLDHQSLFGISCPSVSLCVAVGGGEVFTSTDPTGGAGTWTGAAVYDTGPSDLAALIGISCASASLCVAIDNLGHVLTTANPTGGAGAWSEANVEGGYVGFYNVSSVSCPSVSLCVAVDDAGNVLTSTNPAAGGNAWSSVLIDAPACVPATQCLTERLYEHDDHGTRVVDSAPPGTGRVVAHVRLTGNLLTWTHAVTPHALRLG